MTKGDVSPIEIVETEYGAKYKYRIEKKNKYPSGTCGIVVSLYSSGTACEVEVWDDDGYPVDVITYKLSEVEKCI